MEPSYHLVLTQSTDLEVKELRGWGEVKELRGWGDQAHGISKGTASVRGRARLL